MIKNYITLANTTSQQIISLIQNNIANFINASNPNFMNMVNLLEVAILVVLSALTYCGRIHRYLIQENPSTFVVMWNYLKTYMTWKNLT